MEQIESLLRSLFTFDAANQELLLRSALIIGVLVLLRYLILWIFYRRTEDVRSRYHARKFSAYAAFSVGLFLLLRLWLEGFTDLSTFLGLLSAGLAIALRDLIASIAGWAYIIWRRPFYEGDRVQIGEHKGDIIDLRLFRFSLMEIGNWVDADQSTGRVVHIPNSRVLSDPIANYSQGFNYIWNELAVLVTFESNWARAKGILQAVADSHSAHLSETAKEAVREAGKKTMIFYSVLTPKVWTRVVDSGVLLTIRYLCEPRRRRSTEEKIWEDVLRQFALCNDVDFAYPTIRRYDNPREGKSGTQPGAEQEPPQ